MENEKVYLCIENLLYILAKSRLDKGEISG